MKKILVTGGLGFIGSNWIRMHRDVYDIFCLDNMSYSANEEILWEGGFLHERGDIRDTELVRRILRERKIESIVHFAAESHVDNSIRNPNLFMETNALGTLSLLNAFLSEKLSGRFHHVSTDEVYGSLGFSDSPFDENSCYAPNSPYSASKAASDHLVRAFHRTHGIDATISNCSNNYGPWQHSEKLIPLVISRILDGGRIPIYGDGSNVRDWIHVEDHCFAITRILENGVSGRTYCVGGDNEVSNLDLVRNICCAATLVFASDSTMREKFPNCPWEAPHKLIDFVEDRKGHDLRYAIDSRRIREELGHENRMTDFFLHLCDTFRWYASRNK